VKTPTATVSIIQQLINNHPAAAAAASEDAASVALPDTPCHHSPNKASAKAIRTDAA